MNHACVGRKPVSEMRARERKFMKRHICETCPLWMELDRGPGTG